MIGAKRKPVAHPIVLAPVIKHFVCDIAGELRVVDLEWMFELHAVAITPGINLRRAPAALNPVAIDQGELLNRKAHYRTQRQPFFAFRLAVGRARFAMKIERIHAEVFIQLEYRAKTPAPVYRRSQIAANSQSSLDRKINCFAQWNRKLEINPTLRVRFGHLGLSWHGTLAGRAQKYRAEKQNRRLEPHYLCLARV